MHVPKAARNFEPAHFAIQNKRDRVAVQRGLVDFNDGGGEPGQIMADVHAAMERAVFGKIEGRMVGFHRGGGIGGHANMRRFDLGQTYTPTTSMIKPKTARQFLKGLAKLRREVINPTGEMVLDPDVNVYDKRNGNPVSASDVMVYRRKNKLATMEKLGNGAFATVYAIDEHRVLKVMTGKDTNYNKFVDLAIKNSHNPHFPKIYYRGSWGNYRVIVMERLSSGHYDRRSHFCTLFSMHDNPFMSIKDPHMQEAVDLLKKHSMDNDVYAKNVLAREDGTVVITDPVAG